MIEILPLLKCLVKSQFAYLTSHGCLGKICYGCHNVLHSIRCFIRVFYLNIEDCIYVKCYIVFCHCDLAGYFNGLLSQIVNIRYFVNYRNFEV